MTAIAKEDIDLDSTVLLPFDWSHRIGSATIATKQFTVSPENGVTVADSTIDNTTKKVTVKVTPNAAVVSLGDTVRLTNRITTSAGEELDLSLDLSITET